MEKSDWQALTYYRRACAYTNGHADAELAIGKLLLDGSARCGVVQDVEQAGIWLESSARKGNAEAVRHTSLAF